MKRNRSILSLAILVITLLCTMPAMAQSGEKSVGLRAGYTSSNEAPVAGLYFQYRFSKFFRVKPAIDYYFRHNDVDAFAFNLNAEVPIDITMTRLTIYPLAGFNVTARNERNHDLATGDDSTTRDTRLGFNVGAGLEYRFTSHLKVGIEAKYGYVRHFSGANVTASIGYVF